MQNSVLHILRAPFGGAFRHVYDLIRMQRKRGMSVGLVVDSADYGTGSSTKLAELTMECDLGIDRIAIPRRPGLQDFTAGRNIRNKYRGHPPDFVHGHGAKGAAYARIIGKQLGSVAICTPHGGALHYSHKSLSGAAYLLMERALKRYTGGMIFESKYAHRSYIEKLGNFTFPFQVIANGLYEAEFTPVDNQSAQYDFLFIGEFRELKGIFTLLDAVGRLRAAGRRISILMVGAGPDEELLRRRIKLERLEEYVAVSPPIHPARAAFSQARCLVVPSHKESMPYIVLEAIAVRIPLITTAVGGIPEIYAPFEGELIPAADAPSLARAMAEFIDSPEKLEASAHTLHSRKRETLTVADMEARVFNFYRSVSESRAGASVPA